MSISRSCEPISVLFVLPNFRAGGAERVILTLLSQLDRARFAPELVVLDGSGEFIDLVPRDVILHDLGATRLKTAFLPLLRVIRQRRPALIFSTHSYVSIALLAARDVFPRASKILVREPNTPSKSLPDMSYGRLLHLGYRTFLRRADLTICLNSITESEMLTTYHVAPSRLVRMPNPVAISPLRQAADPMIREPGPGLRLVAAGRLNHAKGFDRLLKAMVSMPDETVLALYGSGPEEAALKALSSRLALGSKVRFAGFEPQLAPALAGADAVIVPSRWEGMPNIVLETLACGTPVVATSEAGGVIDLADETTGDALTLVSSQPELVAAMTEVAISGHSGVRASLLPKRYEEQNVVKLFADTLEKTFPPLKG